MKRTSHLVVAALTCMTLTGLAERTLAADYLPCQFDVGVTYRCNIVIGYSMPLAPWYSYFPYDPETQRMGPVSYFPSWGQPPAGPGPQSAPFPAPANPFDQQGRISTGATQRVSFETPAYWHRP